mmetsp:Transcript_20749/g.50841  ORF Transcript_20749/g.50841 Transcript_20749/m.50841 type:complete len:367 (-) Transcript_20749:798-1898(-)
MRAGVRSVPKLTTRGLHQSRVVCHPSRILRINIHLHTVPMVHSHSTRVPVRTGIIRLYIELCIHSLADHLQLHLLTLADLRLHLIRQLVFVKKLRPPELTPTMLHHRLVQMISRLPGLPSINRHIHAVDPTAPAGPCHTPDLNLVVLLFTHRTILGRPANNRLHRHFLHSLNRPQRWVLLRWPMREVVLEVDVRRHAPALQRGMRIRPQVDLVQKLRLPSPSMPRNHSSDWIPVVTWQITTIHLVAHKSVTKRIDHFVQKRRPTVRIARLAGIIRLEMAMPILLRVLLSKRILGSNRSLVPQSIRVHIHPAVLQHITHAGTPVLGIGNRSHVPMRGVEHRLPVQSVIVLTTIPSTLHHTHSLHFRK